MTETTCPTCGGSGRTEGGEGAQVCDTCLGVGGIKVARSDPPIQPNWKAPWGPQPPPLPPRGKTLVVSHT